MVHEIVDEQQSSPAVPQNAGEENKTLMQQQQKKLIVVGCALLPKKVARYLTPKMLQAAAESNILLKQIDYSRPLAPQGPFDVIIHKLRPNPDWEQQLLQYVRDNPQVVVVDRLDKIRQVHNRATMLRPLQGDGIILQQPLPQAGAVPATATAATAGAQPCSSPTAASPAAAPLQQQRQQLGEVVQVQAPLQVEIAEGMSEAEAQAALAAAGLCAPLLCKPLWTDGRDGSHNMAVLHDLQALGRLLRGDVCHEFKPPLVVQQFVEHGGVLFKVYVLGEQTYVTARPSLGETVLEPEHAVQQLPRISCVSVFSKQQQHQKHMQVLLPAASADQAAAAPQQQPAGSIQASTALAPAPAPTAAGDRQSTSSDAGHVHQQHQQQQQQPGPCPSAELAAVSAQSVWRPPSSSIAPPEWLTSALAAALRRELGLLLFNFDLILPLQQQQQEDALRKCYVVDVNFFPGVDKLKDADKLFIDFLRWAAGTEPAAGYCLEEQQQQLQEQQQQEKVQKDSKHVQPQLSTGAEAPCATGVGCGGKAAAQCITGAKVRVRSTTTSSSGDEAPRRRRSSSGGSSSTSSSVDGGSGSRRLQQSLSAGRSASSSGGIVVGSHRHSSSGLGAAVSSAQWGDSRALGSSPPPQVQVAGCS